jgi:hypothetical protein
MLSIILDQIYFEMPQEKNFFHTKMAKISRDF